jgi:hypothetical protein
MTPHRALELVMLSDEQIVRAKHLCAAARGVGTARARCTA